MGLVHGHHGDFHVSRKFQKVIAFQPLRGYVDNLVGTLRRKGQRTSNLPLCQGGIDERGVDAYLVQGLHLILHQGDQGRYH